MIDPALTVLNRYELSADPQSARAAFAALAARVEAEGHPGVLSYRFFVNDGSATARAVIHYTGPEAWIGHHDIAMAWPQMRALHGLARLAEVTFLGPVTPEILDWLAASPLTARVETGFTAAAGFRRTSLGG